MPPQQDKPGSVSLNLDTLERDGEARDPFTVVVGGKPYTMADPQELEWDVLVAVSRDPVTFLRAAVPAAKAAEFTASVGKEPAWKVNRLSEAYRQHFGLPDDPESAASS